MFDVILETRLIIAVSLYSYPEKFDCDIRPRNAQIAKIIEEAASSVVL